MALSNDESRSYFRKPSVARIEFNYLNVQMHVGFLSYVFILIKRIDTGTGKLTFYSTRKGTHIDLRKPASLLNSCSAQFPLFFLSKLFGSMNRLLFLSKLFGGIFHIN